MGYPLQTSNRCLDGPPECFRRDDARVLRGARLVRLRQRRYARSCRRGRRIERMEHVIELKSRLLFRIELDLGASMDAGATPYGQRRIFPVSGGRFEGERVRGVVLPETSGDWLLARQDGA